MVVLMLLVIAVAVGCWIMAAINSVRMHGEVKEGRRILLLFSPMVVFALKDADLYLTEKGIAYLKRFRSWVLRFLACLPVLLILMIIASQTPV